MNTSKLISKLTENWIAKVVCIAVAILVYIFHQIVALDHKTFTVPLEIKQDGLMVNVSEVPHYVKIKVRCNSDSIGAITPQGINASINLNQYTMTGDYDVPVSVLISEDLMLIDPLEVSVKPEHISVSLDEKVQKYVSVTPAVSGEVSHGYLINGIEIVPSTVKITGPKKIVENTNYVYSEKVNVKGAATGFSTDVSLDNINRLVETHEEGKFRVTVSVSPAPSEQKFSDINPSIISLSPKFINETDIPKLSFTLAGTVPALEGFELQSENVVVDCSSITEIGQYELPVLFVLPQNISVKEKSYESVNLVISENPDYTEELANALEQASTEENSDEENVNSENVQNDKVEGETSETEKQNSDNGD